MVTSRLARVSCERSMPSQMVTRFVEGIVTNMPKIKTHKSTAKRFRITGSGKLRRRKQGSSHFRRRKSKRVLRSLDKNEPVASADDKRVRRILGLRRRSKR